MDVIYFILKDVILPIFIVILTAYITLCINKKIEGPRFLIMHSEFGNLNEKFIEDNVVRLNGYYSYQKEFD